VPAELERRSVQPAPGEWWEVIDPSSGRIPRVRIRSVEGDRVVWGFRNNAFTSSIRMFAELYRRAPLDPQLAPKPPEGIPPPSSTPPITAPTPPPREKNPDAVALGRLGGMKGGRARAAALTPQRRKDIARKAAAARWQGGA